MSKRTNGPWESRGKGVFASGRRIGGFEVMGAAQKYGPSDKANARLAAAAPELLAAAKALLNAPYGTVGNCDDWDTAMHLLDHAIAKAEGK